MRSLIRSLPAPIRAALTKHPGPEDMASVVNGTSVGVFVTSLNALLYAAGAFDGEGLSFLVLWLGVVLAMCVTLARMSARLAGRQVHPGASIGGAICSADATDPVELLQRADLGLNRAKEDGRGACVKFDDQLRERPIANDRVEAGLRAALGDDPIHVQYQPKMALPEGGLPGAEALVRWQTPDGCMVPPDCFLPVAAERGLLPTLSRRIAEAVAGDILSWRDAALAPGKIALNIHPDDRKSPELLMETVGMFESRGIDGRDLVLEITEG